MKKAPRGAFFILNILAKPQVLTEGENCFSSRHTAADEYKYRVFPELFHFY